MPPETWQAIVDRDGGCMAHRMGFDLDHRCRGHLVVHHRLLRSQGGDHALDNLVALCDDHHRRAHDFDRAGAEAAGVIVRRGGR